MLLFNRKCLYELLLIGCFSLQVGDCRLERRKLIQTKVNSSFRILIFRFCFFGANKFSFSDFRVNYFGLVLAVKSQAPDKAPAKNGSSFNQLLGIKGASQETVSPRNLFVFY